MFCALAMETDTTAQKTKQAIVLRFRLILFIQWAPTGCGESNRDVHLPFLLHTNLELARPLRPLLWQLRKPEWQLCEKEPISIQRPKLLPAVRLHDATRTHAVLAAANSTPGAN